MLKSKVTQYSLFTTYLILHFAVFLFEDLRINIIYFLALQFFIFLNYLAIFWWINKTKNMVDVKFVYLVTFFISLLYMIQFTSLSTDIYRYIWDGMIYSSGFNPYFYKVTDHLLESFRSSYELYRKMQWTNEYTVYPPIAQFIFYFVYQSYKIFGLFGAKLVMVLPVITTFVIIKKYLEPKFFLLFVLNPLLLFEAFNGAHLDNFLLLVTTLFLILISNKKLYESGLVLLTGVFIKVFPIIFIPFVFLKILKNKKYLKLLYLMLGGIIFGILLYSPFIFNSPQNFNNYLYKLGSIEFSKFPIYRYYAYVGSLEFNVGIYKLFNSIWRYLGYQGTARNLTYLVNLAILILISFKYKRDKGQYLSKAIFLIGFIFLLFGPVFFPWYSLILIVPIFMYANTLKNPKVLIPFFVIQFLLLLTYFDEYILQTKMYSNLNSVIWMLFHITSWSYILILILKKTRRDLSMLR